MFRGVEVESRVILHVYHWREHVKLQMRKDKTKQKKTGADTDERYGLAEKKKYVLLTIRKATVV